jgi:arylsulfatase A-like enzyme
MKSTHEHGVLRPWHAPVLAASAYVAIAAIEQVGWWRRDLAADVFWVSQAALLAAALAGALAAALRLRICDTLSIGIPASATAGVSAVFLLRYEHLPTAGALLLGAVTGVALGMALSATLVRLALRPWGLSIALVPLLVAALGAATSGVRISPTRPTRHGTDVVLIVLDTTSRTHLSTYGYARRTSPTLEWLAHDAAVYDDAWSVAPWTPSSHASMFTGLLPAQHGVDGADPTVFPQRLTTLATTFQSSGYRTAGFVSNPNIAAPGWSHGYDQYDTPWVRGRHSLVWFSNMWNLGAPDAWSRNARNVSARTLTLARSWWEKSAGSARFLFVNLMDPHRPYDPPKEALRHFLSDTDLRDAFTVDQDPDTYSVTPGLDARSAQMLRGLYDGEISTMDLEIGRFLQWLKQRGELDRTVVAIVADHGERLGERGLVGHEAAGQLCMDPFLLHVPLLVRYPPAVPSGRIQRRVQTHHLGGHLLRLAGVRATAPALAEDRLASEDAPLVVAQFQHPRWMLDRLHSRLTAPDLERWSGDRVFVADRRYALVSRVDAGVQPELLIDMKTDPEWTQNLLTKEPVIVDRLAAEAARLPRFGTPAASEPDPVTLEELRSLGYVQH